VRCKCVQMSAAHRRDAIKIALAVTIQRAGYLSRLEVSHATSAHVELRADIEVPLYVDGGTAIIIVTVHTIEAVARRIRKRNPSAKMVAD
jgi:hypothetical protein